MKTIRISDITLKQETYLRKTFREKLEIVKLLDQLKVDVIETEGIHQQKSDSICIKAYAQSIENSILAVPTALTEKGVLEVWASINQAKHPRIQVAVPTSSVQMEYQYHLKPEGMKALSAQIINACLKCCPDVEFIALDATRSDKDFLFDLLNDAISAGVQTITICDDAGNMLPNEYKDFLQQLKQNIPNIDQITLGISCCNKISAADMCAFEGILAGAGEIKATVGLADTIALPHIVNLLARKGEAYQVTTTIKTVELNRVTEKIQSLATQEKPTKSPFEDGVIHDRQENTFTVHDSLETIIREIVRLGYNLAPEDNTAVYDEFIRIAGKKNQVTTKELETIVATAALDVPPVFKIESYVINSGNTISATSHIRLHKDGKVLEGVSVGDGAVDASFLAIEQITGKHYELDDFQIQAVTEGREAMGETIVRLRSGGRLYSGRGISTDIVGSSIQAYINALNKIAFEEKGENS